MVVTNFVLFVLNYCDIGLFGTSHVLFEEIEFGRPYRARIVDEGTLVDSHIWDGSILYVAVMAVILYILVNVPHNEVVFMVVSIQFGEVNCVFVNGKYTSYLTL